MDLIGRNNFVSKGCNKAVKTKIKIEIIKNKKILKQNGE